MNTMIITCLAVGVFTFIIGVFVGLKFTLFNKNNYYMDSLKEINDSLETFNRIESVEINTAIKISNGNIYCELLVLLEQKKLDAAQQILEECLEELYSNWIYEDNKNEFVVDFIELIEANAKRYKSFKKITQK